MKVSVQWLKELVDLGDMPVPELARILTMAGLEVEEVVPLAGAFSGIVVGHVVKVGPHPDADKLRVTQVDAGTGELLQIVCGAPNVAEGQKVPCATIGARLPAGEGGKPFEIRKAKLRGVESNGMLCSARELGLSQDHAGLMVLDAAAPVGRDVREVLGLDDTYLTLKLTPNRGDCLSMLGIARDVAAITGRALRAPIPEPVPTTITERRAVSIAAPDRCSHYYGRVVNGLDPAARTPDWMARRLERAGFRVIHPLVDITNYVMLERGQPMHAFDHAKLQGAIGVRLMREGESVRLLNEQEVAFRDGLLVITDADRPCALAGVMGGFDSMVGAETTAVFFESAFFTPESVQGRARALGFNSDAAYRFERGVDPGGAGAAIERATQLAIRICGGAAGPLSHAEGERVRRSPVLVRPERVRRLLGYGVANEEIHEILKHLSCLPEEIAQGVSATPPSWRFDLAIEEDFVEEVARVHGYDHVPAKPPVSSVPMVRLADGTRSRFDLRRLLAGLGYQEVVNYSFVPEEWEAELNGNRSPVRLANPIASQMSVMRTSLVPGLVQTLRSNLNRGEARARLFEIGRCFLGEEASLSVQPERIAGLAFGARRPEQWAEPEARSDFFDAKGDVEALAGGRPLSFARGSHPACHPGRCASVTFAGRPIGWIGELHPRLLQRFELQHAPVAFELDTEPLLSGAAPRFQGVSRMPTVRRDLALLVPDEVAAGALLEAARRVAPAFVKEVEVFDQYRGQGVESGKKSLALRIVMQDTDRTLTDVEVEAAVASVREKLVQQFKAQPRT